MIDPAPVFAAAAAAADTSSGGGTDPISAILQYGVLGIIVVLFVFGQIAPGYALKREQAENDRLRKLIEDDVLPAMTVFNTTQAESQKVLTEVSKLLVVLNQKTGQPGAGV